MDGKPPRAKASSLVLGEIPPVHRMDNLRTDVLSQRRESRQEFPERNLQSHETDVRYQQAARPFGVS